MEDLQDLLDEYDAFAPTCETCGEPLVMVDEGNVVRSWKHEDDNSTCTDVVLDLDQSDEDRAQSLLTLFEEFGGHDDAVNQARNDSQLIPDDEFEDHARQLAEDIGAIPDDLSWPLTCIDWEQAAQELQHDYTCIEWDGTTYYYRSV